jgi:hypothetical protein
MSSVTDFAYAQARLQARHAARPDAATWRRLAGFGDRLRFLQHARTTRLRPWVQQFSSRTDIHELELSIRSQFRQSISEVASWQPRPWRKAVSWTAQLLDLPALQHLLLGNPPPVWIGKDPVLRPFAMADMRQRLQALEDSEYAPLVRGWQNGTPLLDSWLTSWRSLWPESPSKFVRPLDQLIDQFQQLVIVPGTEDGTGHHTLDGEQLADKLTYAFRRCSHQPATAFLHLAMVALDLQQLRAALLRRTLFPEFKGEDR